MNQVQNESSSTNTILIVFVLAAIVAFGVWFFTQNGAAVPEEEGGINVDVNLPTPPAPAPTGGETNTP